MKLKISDLRFRPRGHGSDDLPAMLDIEFQSYREPWDHDAFLDFTSASACNQTWVAEWMSRRGTCIVGYILWECRKRSLRLVSVAVGPQFRGLGVGRWLIEQVMAKLNPEGRKELVIEVPFTDDHLGSMKFLRAIGIEAEGTVQKDGGEYVVFRTGLSEAKCRGK